ncbi:S phase cyclin A-associated protein in the endoplasmic reticulum-like isoform X2 [Ornithodoros turicata]|uniref:S phase cyclin A-associated protein in the endoplasmic reticulum-like isoform X2 n=1 Tax=Ornithodoros turicata TaxID=34597 RepID=UPI003138C099
MHSVASKPPRSPSGIGSMSQARGGAKLRARSSSAGRGPDKGLRARYWAYLFENLRRAVDEIYKTCETDESILECKEAVMALENYSKEFKALIDWIELSKELENTPPPNRPTCLAWEIRKSNSGRSVSRGAGMFPQPPRQLVTVGTQSEALLPVIPSSSDSAESGSEKEASPAAPDFPSSPAVSSFEAAPQQAGEPDPSVAKMDQRETSELPRNNDIVVANKCAAAEQHLSTEPATAVPEVDSKQSVSGTLAVEPDISKDTESITTTCTTTQNAEATPEIPAADDTTTVASKTTEGSSASTSVSIPQTTHAPTSTSVASPTVVVAKINSDLRQSHVPKTTSAPPSSSSRSATTVAKSGPPKTARPSSSSDTKPRSLTAATRSPTTTRQTFSRPQNLRPSSASNASFSSASSTSAKRPVSASTRVQPAVPPVQNRAALPHPHPPPTECPPMLKDTQRSGSSSCLSFESSSSTSSCRSWADKVRGGSVEPEVLRSTSFDPIVIDEADDTEGWETVCRSKPKLRNSPHKNIKPSTRNSQPFGVSRSPSAPSINLSNVSGKSRRSSAPTNQRDSFGNSTSRGRPDSNARLGAHSQNAKSLPLLGGKVDPGSARRNQRGSSEGKVISVMSRSRSFVGPEERGGAANLSASKKGAQSSASGKEPRQRSQDGGAKHLMINVGRSKSFVGTCRAVSEAAENESDARTAFVDVVEDAAETKKDSTVTTSKALPPDRNAGKEDVVLKDKTTDSDTQEEEEDRLETEEIINDLGLSWGEQMDCLDLELRTPGRAVQMHENLSAASRKRPLSETLQRNKEKQAKAQELRDRLREEKAQRCRDFSKKVEEKKAQQEELQNQLRIIIEKRLQRAAEKREMALKNKVKKAHDEEEKVNEIAFINSLEAQNKRIDILSKEKDHEARLQDIQEERQRKLEEKAAKEAAAEERRKVLEAERQAKLLEIREKRKLKDEKVQQQQQEKEKLRLNLLKQKEKEREQRLSALTAAQQATAEELQKKIQQKQEESARRHEENMEQIRHKAFELSVRKCSSNVDEAPHPVPYETKKICSLCNVLIGSEVYLLSHLRGKKHHQAVRDNHQGMAPSMEELESYNLKHIVDAPADKLDPDIMIDKERQKAQKKRCKKLRQKMSARGKLYEKAFAEKVRTTDSKSKFRLVKHVKEVNRCLANQGTGPWDPALISSLDRALGEMERTLERGTAEDRDAFRILGGFAALCDVLGCILKSTPDCLPVIPARCLIRTCTVLRLACTSCYFSCEYLLFSNRVATLLDMVAHRLNILMPDDEKALTSSLVATGPGASGLRTDPVSGALLHLLRVSLEGLTGALTGAVTSENSTEIIRQRLLDVLSYAVSIGTVDKVAKHLTSVRGPVDSEPEQLTDFLVNCLDFVACLAQLLARCNCKDHAVLTITDTSTTNNNKTKQQKTTNETKNKQAEEEGTHLVGTFRVTELVGAVSLLYGTLLHSGAPSRGETPPPPLALPTLSMTKAALQLLNQLARLDLAMFQTVLGSEGMSLQLRHIASYLLWYTNHWELEDLLHEVVLLVGYFAVLSPDNQMVIQSGECPTLLQILCTLPFEYFSDPKLTTVLLPTLVACCYNNAENCAILQQELSPVLLANFIEEHLLDLHCSKKKALTEEEQRWSLENRFPKSRWTAAKAFFSVDCS